MEIISKIGLIATVSAGVIGGSAGISYLLSLPKNLKQDLEKSGIEFLNTNQEGENNDDTIWTKLAEKHAEDATTTNSIKKITGLTIQKQTGSPAPTTPHPGIKLLKTKCDELFKKTKKDSDYSQAKEDATNWCTKKQIEPPK